MKGHSLLGGRLWMLLGIAVVLISGHAIILYYFSSHVVMSAAVVAAVIVVAMIKHAGLFGSLYSLLRRRSHL